jgi:hypothetical protein
MRPKRITYQQIKPTRTGNGKYPDLKSQDVVWIPLHIKELYDYIQKLKKSKDPIDQHNLGILEMTSPDLKKKTKEFGGGLNSVVSSIEGLYHNFYEKEPRQRDITYPQLQDLAHISEIMNVVEPQFPVIEFDGPAPEQAKASKSPVLPEFVARVKKPEIKGDKLIFGNGLFEQ